MKNAQKKLLREYIRELLKEDAWANPGPPKMAPGSENALSKENKMTFNTRDGHLTFWLPRGAEKNTRDGYIPYDETIKFTEFDLTKEEFLNGYKSRQIDDDLWNSYWKAQKEHMKNSLESDPNVEVIELRGQNFYRVKTDGPLGVTNGKYDGTEPSTKEQFAKMSLEDKLLHTYFYDYTASIWAIRDADVFNKDEMFNTYKRPARQKPSDEQLLPENDWAVDEVKKFREAFVPLEQRLGKKKLEKLMKSVARKADRVIDQIPEAEDIVDEKFVQIGWDEATSYLSGIMKWRHEALGDGLLTAGISRAIMHGDDHTVSMRGKWPIWVKLLELIEKAPKITFASDQEVLDAFPAYVEKLLKSSYYGDIVPMIGRAWKKGDPATYKKGYAKLRAALAGNRSVGTFINKPKDLYEPIYYDGRQRTDMALPDAARIHFVRDNINK